MPLLRADYPFEATNFTPPPMASQEEQKSWTHPPGSNLVVWANALRYSPIVSCELGDGTSAFANPGFQRLIGNALGWTASPAAKSWAREFSDTEPTL